MCIFFRKKPENNYFRNHIYQTKYQSLQMNHLHTNPLSIFIGTYTKESSQGIYNITIDTTTFEAKQHEVLPTDNPSFLAFSPDRNKLYAVNESGMYMQDTVSAFSRHSGNWELINTITTEGTDPCYITATEKHLFIANYSSGSLCVINLDEKGNLVDTAQLICFSGSGPNAARQTESHIHCAHFSPDQSFLFVTDLGSDEVHSFKYEAHKTQPLTKVNTIKTLSGAGPRHIIFNKEGNIAYLILELNASVSAYRHSEGILSHLQTIAMESVDFKGEVCAADIHLSNDEKYLYTSNRGDSNKIIVFEVLPDNQLTKIQEIASEGNGPRNFMISPDDSLILVAHQYSNTIQIFERDKETGTLLWTNRNVEISSPVCTVI